jgi:hypothetical protein
MTIIVIIVLLSSLSISLFLEQEIIAEVADDTYYYYEYDYVKDYEDEYFNKNQVTHSDIQAG